MNEPRLDQDRPWRCDFCGALKKLYEAIPYNDLRICGNCDRAMKERAKKVKIKENFYDKHLQDEAVPSKGDKGRR